MGIWDTQIKSVFTHSLRKSCSNTSGRLGLNNVADLIGCDIGALKAIDTRDALANSLYTRLFEWLVDQINKSLEVGKWLIGRSISILDIYGLESFDACLCCILHYSCLFVNDIHANAHVFAEKQQMRDCSSTLIAIQVRAGACLFTSGRGTISRDGTVRFWWDRMSHRCLKGHDWSAVTALADKPLAKS